jgi:hypothetical protein
MTTIVDVIVAEFTVSLITIIVEMMGEEETMITIVIITEVMMIIVASIMERMITTVIVAENEEILEVGVEGGGRISMNLVVVGRMNWEKEGTIIHPIANNDLTLERVQVIL